MENEKINSENSLNLNINSETSENKYIKKKNKVNKKNDTVLDDETQPDFIMIDMSYFIFYRYYALLAWWKLAKPEEPLENPIENKEFVYKFNQTFVDKITEIPKKLKIKNFIYIAGLDCPKKNIWRNKLFEKYKEQRVYDDDFLGGPFFKIGLDLLKELNIPALKYDTFEADDCIAIMTKNILSKDVDNTIYIIANDMDYLQLAGPKVKIVNLKYKFLTDNKNCSGNPEKDLFCKIIMGDKSDNIPSIFNKCGIKTAIKCYEDKKYFEDRLKKENAYELYERNKKLIDFNEIPLDDVYKFKKYNMHL
mgnify:CR=1 FL=1|tara:strand:+ start:15397 stop:16317 length:921 start_codon:yes stop_codon:yes gene_type:complete